MHSESPFVQGWLTSARRVNSPNFDARPDFATLDVVVLHHISLPAGRFEGDAVERLFTNRISTDEPELSEVAELRVSAHFFIRRDGEIVQFVSVFDRAWHAGVSSWRGRERVNDFSIGIELEGDERTAFSPAQYGALNETLQHIHSALGCNALTTHSEIALGRKIDPGPKFDFSLIQLSVTQNS
jgi:N-acetyl-anhydromuramoyl-L-alanine amidase